MHICSILYGLFAVAYLGGGGGGIGPWPPFGNKIFFHHRKKLKNFVRPPCVSTSGHRKFAPTPLEILITPLHILYVHKRNARSSIEVYTGMAALLATFQRINWM